MKYQAVIFDLDGTLLDTLEDLAEAGNAALAEAGYPVHPVAAYRKFVGSGMYNLMLRAMPKGEMEHLAPEARTKLVDACREHYEAGGDRLTRPYAGVMELLDALWTRNIPTAVLTNKPHEAALRVVAKKIPGQRFTVIRGAFPDVPLKPDPTAALEVAQMLGATSNTVLYLGDSDVDMHTAKNAGFHAVGAAWGFRDEAELREHGADVICAGPLDALRYIEKALEA